MLENKSNKQSQKLQNNPKNKFFKTKDVTTKRNVSAPTTVFNHSYADKTRQCLSTKKQPFLPKTKHALGKAKQSKSNANSISKNTTMTQYNFSFNKANNKPKTTKTPITKHNNQFSGKQKFNNSKSQATQVHKP